jgi:hypothetical protein
MKRGQMRRQPRHERWSRQINDKLLDATCGDSDGGGNGATQTFLELFTVLGLTPDDQDALGKHPCRSGEAKNARWLGEMDVGDLCRQSSKVG